MSVAVKCAYDGRAYHGFARQPDVTTIEGTLIDVLIELGYIINPKTSQFRSASRTDKGVSAFGNVFVFSTDSSCENLLIDCTKNLEDIILYGIHVVDDGFNPRYARQRRYRYYLQNSDYDVESIQKTASLFEGTHDFTNFARIESHRNPVRTIDSITISIKEGCIRFDFSAQTYLWHQIRRIISAIQQVEEKKIARDEIITYLQQPNIQADFGVATSESLILMDVLYDFQFTYYDLLLKEKNELRENLETDLKCLS